MNQICRRRKHLQATALLKRSVMQVRILLRLSRRRHPLPPQKLLHRAANEDLWLARVIRERLPSRVPIYLREHPPFQLCQMLLHRALARALSTADPGRPHECHTLCFQHPNHLHFLHRHHQFKHNHDFPMFQHSVHITLATLRLVSATSIFEKINYDLMTFWVTITVNDQ